MRRFIATMQMSIDARIEGPEGYADWVEAWSDVANVVPEVDACLLGGGMYPGYEQYWSAIDRNPTQRIEMTGRLPTEAEVDYARFAMSTPHFVLSRTASAAGWSHTSLLRDIEQVHALKEQAGKGVYVVGGASLVASLIDLGLIDELRLTVHPLVVGTGKPLFDTIGRRHGLRLRTAEPLPGGRVSLSYDLEAEPAGTVAAVRELSAA
jgi:dihydrofolate reductase